MQESGPNCPSPAFGLEGEKEKKEKGGVRLFVRRERK